MVVQNLRQKTQDSERIINAFIKDIVLTDLSSLELRVLSSMQTKGKQK